MVNRYVLMRIINQVLPDLGEWEITIQGRITIYCAFMNGGKLTYWPGALLGLIENENGFEELLSRNIKKPGFKVTCIQIGHSPEGIDVTIGFDNESR